MSGSGLLCVALDPGPGQWLTRLARDLLRHPPRFPWRLALGPRCEGAFGPEFDANCVTRALSDIGTEQNVASLFESIGWRTGGVLLAAAGWPVERVLLKAAQQQHLRTGQYVETWYGYRRRLAPSIDWPAVDHLLLPDATAVGEAQDEGIDAAHIHVVGNPAWEDITAGSGGDTTQWLFIDAPVRRDYGDVLGYDESDAWDLVAAEHDRRKMAKPILFATHPTDLNKAIPIGAVAVGYDTSVLDSVGVVFGMFSAPLIDAYLNGRRVVSVQPNTRRDLNPLSRRRLVPLATDAASLSAALDLPLLGVDAAFRESMHDSLFRLRAAAEEVMNG
jgi:hypothetical protein